MVVILFAVGDSRFFFYRMYDIRNDILACLLLQDVIISCYISEFVYTYLYLIAFEYT